MDAHVASCGILPGAGWLVFKALQHADAVHGMQRGLCCSLQMHFQGKQLESESSRVSSSGVRRTTTANRAQSASLQVSLASLVGCFAASSFMLGKGCGVGGQDHLQG